jgi:hypothetical protein
VGLEATEFFYYYRYGRNSTYELSRNEQFVFTNVARANKLRLSIHLANTETRVYEHFNN